MIPHIKFDKPTLYTSNQDITKDKKFTYLTASVTSANSTLEVQSIVGFAINKNLCLGGIGQEDYELVKTHASTAPSGTTITLNAVVTKSHPIDTKVYLVDYDAIEFDWSTTTAGTKSELGTMTIDVEQPDSFYNDTTQSSGYYFVRFYNTIGGTIAANITDWSDPIPYAGYSDNTVFSIKQRALNAIGETIGGVITHNFLNESLWEARREYHKARGKRPFRMKNDVDIGNVATGDYRVLSPSDLEEPATSENVFGVRIGTEKNMNYYTKKEWDNDYRDIPHTTLSSAYTVGDAALGCSDVRDFEDSGSVNIEADVIDYSAKDNTLGSMQISTAGASNHDSGKDVWQNVSLGLPNRFVVFLDANGSSYIYFNRPLETAYLGENYYADYYRTLVPMDSDADELDEPEVDLFVSYLIWKIKKRKNPLLKAENDDDYREWIRRKTDALSKEYLGQEILMIPDIGHLL